MGSTTIRLNEDVYARLKAVNRDDETFSETVDRLIGGGSLLDLVGIWSDAEVEDVRSTLDDTDEDAVADVEALIERNNSR